MQSIRLQTETRFSVELHSREERTELDSVRVESMQRGKKGNYRCFLDARLGKRIPRLGMITNLTPVLAFVCSRKP